MFKLYYRGISTTGLHATSSSSLISCVVVVVIVVVVGLLLLLLLVCFHRYRVVVVVGFSPFENKAGPTDGRTDEQTDNPTRIRTDRHIFLYRCVVASKKMTCNRKWS